ncbi:hypothetical protein OPQ81_007232 [Rhizoctonia solani]|nr:hypothetical protein OPQ81_007232 [Rhizoctonia solani]
MCYTPLPPSTPVRDSPKVSEGQGPDYTRIATAFQLDQRPRHRHSVSSSSARSWRSSSSHTPRSPASPHARTDSWVPTSSRFVDHPPSSIDRPRTCRTRKSYGA